MSEEYSMLPPPKPHQNSTMLNIPPNNPTPLIMDKLNKTLFDLLHSNPNYPFIPSQFPILQNALLRTFSSSKTPTHPPYAAMIQASIVKLDEELSMTTEERISEYILKNYEGLPWAHNTILKHHLDKLCQSGELLCDDDDATYYVPGKKRRKCLRRKLLKPKHSHKTKENDQVTDLSDSQVGIQEDDSQLYGRGERKQRRNYVFHEEEEGGDFEKMIVDDKEESGKEMVVVEAVNELLLLKAGDVECKTTELDAAQGKPRPQLDIVCSKQVEDEPLQVDRHLYKAMKLGHSCGGNMMRLSSESAVESDLVGDPLDNYTANLVRSPVAVDPLASVSNIESNVIGSKIEKSDLKEAEPYPSATELMIVPYVDKSVNHATGKLMISLFDSEKPVIICGLYNAKFGEENRKIHGYRSSKKLKPPQKKTEALGLPSSDLSLQRSNKTKVGGCLKEKIDSIAHFNGMWSHLMAKREHAKGGAVVICDGG
ncbi:hypothetical protein KSS87_015489 [Heliosperma pusillum]|nr:hypothetical protein KSS87_015489 [Heliosperma pusillum]